jgi:hypothetical protein
MCFPTVMNLIFAKVTTLKQAESLCDPLFHSGICMFTRMTDLFQLVNKVPQALQIAAIHVFATDTFCAFTPMMPSSAYSPTSGEFVPPVWG